MSYRQTDEHRQKIADAMKGKTNGKGTKKNISEEAKLLRSEKIKAGNTPEVKARRIESIKNTWEKKRLLNPKPPKEPKQKEPKIKVPKEKKERKKYTFSEEAKLRKNERLKAANTPEAKARRVASYKATIEKKRLLNPKPLKPQKIKQIKPPNPKPFYTPKPKIIKPKPLYTPKPPKLERRKRKIKPPKPVVPMTKLIFEQRISEASIRKLAELFGITTDEAKQFFGLSQSMKEKMFLDIKDFLENAGENYFVVEQIDIDDGIRSIILKMI